MGFRWDDGLLGPARRIAELNHTPMRVLAGPGTGKTFAMMRRIARLLQDGSSGERMLVCTFTRTAAHDLQQELSRLGADGVEDVRSGTIHSFCFGLLNRAEVLEATGRVPRPLLAFEERFLLEDLNGDGFGGIRERNRRLQAFNAAWARLQSETPGWPTDEIDRAFHHALLAWLRFHQAMLIGELVPESLRYLRDNPASPHHGAFDHVLVDEYQDLNRAEQSLLDLLAGDGHLLVIGDEDQSIYVSMKYAHPDGVASFHESHPQTHDEGLDECRRCPKRVVAMANALIANNIGRTPRALTARAENPDGEIFVVQWTSIEEEGAGIAEIIRRRIQQQQVQPGKVLVLAPRRLLGYSVRDALNNLGVFAHSFFHEEALEGNPKKLEESLAQQAFTLLSLLANPEDRVALRCWCGFGSSSLRAGAWSRLRQHCEVSGESPRQALERLVAGTLTIANSAQLAARYRELQTQLEILRDRRGQTLVDALFPTGANWTSLMRSLAATIEGDEFDAETLRETLRVGITQPELPTDVDYVRVMSLHKSKGLTADLVVVLGCIEGLIPMMDDGTPAEQAASLEEQRRLFYVAVTRTRNVLLLSSVTQLPRNLAYRMGAQLGQGNQTHASTIASRFFAELGPTRPNAILGRTLVQ